MNDILSINVHLNLGDILLTFQSVLYLSAPGNKMSLKELFAWKVLRINCTNFRCMIGSKLLGRYYRISFKFCLIMSSIVQNVINIENNLKQSFYYLVSPEYCPKMTSRAHALWPRGQQLEDDNKIIWYKRLFCS